LCLQNTLHLRCLANTAITGRARGRAYALKSPKSTHGNRRTRSCIAVAGQIRGIKCRPPAMGRSDGKSGSLVRRGRCGSVSMASLPTSPRRNADWHFFRDGILCTRKCPSELNRGRFCENRIKYGQGLVRRPWGERPGRFAVLDQPASPDGWMTTAAPQFRWRRESDAPNPIRSSNLRLLYSSEAPASYAAFGSAPNAIDTNARAGSEPMSLRHTASSE
jgi:hypothetical protein